MDISIRLETQSDHYVVEALTREAFWDLFKPGCDEHLLVHKLRQVPAFVEELSFVACDGGQIVGHILYSRARVVSSTHETSEVLCMGPVSVLPSYQKKGIGAMLIRHSAERASQLGYKAVIIFGHPDYYPRFGYRDAKVYGIQTSWGENMDAFMALELYPHALDGVTGRFFEDEVFHQLPADELDAFDATFPPKEKHVTDTQLHH